MLKIIKQLDCGCKIAENAVRVFCDACEERILYGQPNIKGDNSFDYPVSYVFRAYEAEINEGVDLPYLKEDRPAQISNVVRNSPIAKPTPRQVYLQEQINALSRVVKEHIQRSIKKTSVKRGHVRID